MTLPDRVVAELARRLPPNDAPDRPLMQLATVADDGGPDVRTVLLTAWDADGFLFNTDSASRKAAQVAARSEVALCLVDGFAGQVVVRGRAEPASPQEIADAFADRSHYLRRLAWRNTADLAALDPAERRLRWAEPLDDGPSPTWTGYRVRPHTVVLWTPDADGPSHRVEHRLSADGLWSACHLPG